MYSAGKSGHSQWKAGEGEPNKWETGLWLCGPGWSIVENIKAQKWVISILFVNYITTSK